LDNNKTADDKKSEKNKYNNEQETKSLIELISHSRKFCCSECNYISDDNNIVGIGLSGEKKLIKKSEKLVKLILDYIKNNSKTEKEKHKIKEKSGVSKEGLNEYETSFEMSSIYTFPTEPISFIPEHTTSSLTSLFPGLPISLLHLAIRLGLI
jgi:hypothetical protein